MNPHFKNRGYFILVSGILATIGLILFSVYFFYNLKPVGSDSNLELKVIKGQGVKEIAAALSQARLIKSVTAFKLYIIFSGKAQHLKPGTYQFNGRMNVPEMVALLIKGMEEKDVPPIPAGATVKEIDRILSSNNIIIPGSLIAFDFKNNELIKEFPFLNGVDNLEGFLYPDTYRFKINSSVEEVTRKLVSNFQERIWPLISQKDNWYEILILASILEKEVPTFEDRQLVAGILEKRIKNGVPLQVDATVIYAKCDGDFRSCHQRQLLKSDFKIDSPYNTYLKLGWPPTPIANMDQMAIQTALSPKSSNYWYYLSSPQETIFSKTLDEHNKNINQYLKLQ